MGNTTLEDFFALVREEEHKQKVLKDNPNFYKKPIFPCVFYVVKHTKNGKDFFMYLHGYSYWTPDGTEHDVDYEWGTLKGATLFDTTSDAYQEIDAIVFGYAGDDIDPKTVRIVPVVKFIKHQYEEYAGPLKAFVDFWKHEFSDWRMMKHWLTNEYGKFGKFLGCSGYPECKNIKNLEIEIDANCPKCGSKLVQKRTRKRLIFYGCSKYPDCDYSTWDTPIEDKTCPKCNKTLLKNKKGEIYCSDENCDYKEKEEK